MIIILDLEKWISPLTRHGIPFHLPIYRDFVSGRHLAHACRVGCVRDPNCQNAKGTRLPTQPMNEKRPSAEGGWRVIHRSRIRPHPMHPVICGSRVHRNDRAQPTGRAPAVLWPYGGGRGVPLGEDADPAGPGESQCPRLGADNRGRPQVHTREKPDFACLRIMMMMAHNQTYRRTVSDMEEIRTIRDGEPAPDHAAPVRHMQTIPDGWTGCWPRTAHRCLAEAGGTNARREPTAAGWRPPGTGRLDSPTWTRATLSRSPRKVSTGSTVSRPSRGCRSYWPRCPRRAAPATPTSGAHAGLMQDSTGLSWRAACPTPIDGTAPSAIPR